MVPQFQYKFDIKCAFLSSWLEEQGIYMSNALASARDFNLYKVPTIVLWNNLTFKWNGLTPDIQIN